MIWSTTRSTVRFHRHGSIALGGLPTLVDRVEDQSSITVGSAVQLSNGRRYNVDSVANPAGVDYSIAYVTAV